MLDKVLLPQARSRWMLPALRSLTPDAVANILSQALTARSPLHEQQLYLLMQQTWPRLAKNINEVKNAVINLPWRTAQPERVHAALPRELLDKARLGMRGDPLTATLGWEAMLRHLMDAWFRGISVVELLWHARGGYILPRCAIHIPPWHYGWAGTPTGINTTPPPHAYARANTGHLCLYPDALSINGQPFPPNKFLIAIANTYGSHPSGGALLRCLAWWWCAANFSSAWLLSFAQTFGQPLRVVKYATEHDGIRSELAQMLEDMGHSAWAVIPEGTTIDFIENSRPATDNPQALLLDKADHICDILLLGQTLTTDVGNSGSRALGQVHSAVRSDIIEAAGSWLAEILNEQLVPAIAALNLSSYDEAALPWWECGLVDAKDTATIANTIKTAVEAGLPIPAAWAYDALDIPPPAPGEPTIHLPTASATSTHAGHLARALYLAAKQRPSP